MAISNPDRVVTKQDLANFYGEILPYLGGMPEVLANKFSRADLYSTDEKVVGCWIDGRPLYQKTVKYTSLSVGTSWNNLDTSTFATSMHTLADAIIMNVDGDGNMYPVSGLLIRLTSSAIQKKYTSSSTFNTVYISYRYTKKADATNSFKFSNETDYSTDEHIVGTWIDGKPLYQKVISLGNLPNSSEKLVPMNISNLDQVWNIRGIVHFTNSGNIFDLPLPNVNPTSSNNIQINRKNNSIQITTGTDRSSVIGYAIVQYTKTTD